jgi:hypothetical protein
MESPSLVPPAKLDAIRRDNVHFTKSFSRHWEANTHQKKSLGRYNLSPAEAQTALLSLLQLYIPL